MKYYQEITLSILCLFLFFGCAKQIYQVAYPTLNDGKYDSEFPYKNCSSELKKISETVYKISGLAYYKSIAFDQNDEVTLLDIKNRNYEKKIKSEFYYNSSVIGSATVINSTRRQVLLLTCAHIITFEDTVYSYYLEDNNKQGFYLQSVSFKIKQNNFIAEFPERGNLEILAVDYKNDIVLLGKEFIHSQQDLIPDFNYPLGDAKKLEWGTFVYMIGFPKGHQMITKGIVSQPNRDKKGAFLVDALFNKGFSGGIVLAIRDGVPNFELVGMAGSVSADINYLMVPPENIKETEFDPRIPFTDDIFVKAEKTINYGITFIISSDIIREFLLENKERIFGRGYSFGDFLD